MPVSQSISPRFQASSFRWYHGGYKAEVSGVVAKVVIRAITTNYNQPNAVSKRPALQHTYDTSKRLTIVNTRALKIFAWRPILRTISSTRPLQDMSDPIEKDSRQTSPFSRAASAHPRNLAVKATSVTAIRYPQVMLESSKPKLVFNPDNVK